MLLFGRLAAYCALGTAPYTNRSTLTLLALSILHIQCNTGSWGSQELFCVIIIYFMTLEHLLIGVAQKEKAGATLPAFSTGVPPHPLTELTFTLRL